MNKQTLITLLVAVALVALLLTFENPFKKETPKPREEDQVELFTFLSEENCSRIVLDTFGTSTTLVRKDGRWVTGKGHKADATRVKNLFDALEQAGKPKLKSHKADHTTYIKYQVDRIFGVQLKMFDLEGNAKVDLIVGNLKTDFMNTPVRRPDSGKVYLIRGMLSQMIRGGAWRDQMVFRFDMPQLRRVAVRTPDESFTIARESPSASWFFSEPTSGPVDMNGVQSWLQQISYLRATDFVDDTTSTATLTSYGLTLPPAQLSIGLDDGSSHTVAFGNLDTVKKMYYAKRLDEPQIYYIAQSTYSVLMGKSDKLKPKPQPKPPILPPVTPVPTTGTAPVAPQPPLPGPAVTTGTAVVTTPPTRVAAPPSSPPVIRRPAPAVAPPPPKADEPTTSGAAK